jgi:hypothetical protein
MALNTYTSERAQARIRLMLLHMSSKSHTAEQMANQLHMSQKTVGGYFRHLHDNDDKRIYVKRWLKLEAEGGRQAVCFVAAYMTGNGKDAPRPRTNNSERCKLYRKKMVDDDMRADVARAKRRAKNIKPHADPLALPANFFNIREVA